jgi:hypothetical protein
MRATCPALINLAIYADSYCLQHLAKCIRVSADSAAVHGEMWGIPDPVAQGILPDPILFVAAILRRIHESTRYGRN